MNVQIKSLIGLLLRLKLNVLTGNVYSILFTLEVNYFIHLIEFLVIFQI